MCSSFSLFVQPNGESASYNPNKKSLVLITEENGVLCDLQIESGHSYQELFISSKKNNG